MKRIRIWFCLVLVTFVTGASGCFQIADRIDDTTMDLRDRYNSGIAWWRMRSYYKDVDFRWDFAKGFKAGYRNIAQGGTGCQPTLPPRKYWKIHHQNPRGQRKVMAWFDGYSHGALIAEQDGVEQWSRIVISPTARRNVRISRGLDPDEDDGMGFEKYLPDFPEEPNLVPPAPAAEEAQALLEALSTAFEDSEQPFDGLTADSELEEPFETNNPSDDNELLDLWEQDFQLPKRNTPGSFKNE